MCNRVFDFERAVCTIACQEVPTDTLHLHEDVSRQNAAWFAVNTKYPNTRFTISPTRADLEKLYAALGRALGKE